MSAASRVVKEHIRNPQQVKEHWQNPWQVIEVWRSPWQVRRHQRNPQQATRMSVIKSSRKLWNASAVHVRSSRDGLYFLARSQWLGDWTVIKEAPSVSSSAVNHLALQHSPALQCNPHPHYQHQQYCNIHYPLYIKYIRHHRWVSRKQQEIDLCVTSMQDMQITKAAEAQQGKMRWRYAKWNWMYKKNWQRHKRGKWNLRWRVWNLTIMQGYCVQEKGC